MEIKLEGKYASNYIIFVQIKDKLNSEEIVNKENEYVYSVGLKSINYLSNHPNSLFVIYLEDKKLFVWEWIYEIEKAINDKAIDISNPSQSTYSYKFNKVLDSKSKNVIHKQVKHVSERIKQYGKALADSKNNVNISSALNTIKSDELKLIGSVVEKVEEAEKLKAENKLREALKIYTNISKVINTDTVFLQCAEICLDLKDYKLVIRNCSKAISKNPRNYYAYLGLGFAYQELKDYKKARGFYDRILKYKQIAEVYIQIGKICYITGDINNAIANLMRSLKETALQKENYIEAEILLADIYTSTFNFTRARFFIDRVLKLQPQNSKALALLGQYHMENGNEDRAIVYFQKTMDNDMNNYNALLGLSIIFIQKNIEKALIFLNALIKEYFSKLILNKGEGNFVITYIGWQKTTFFLISISKEGDTPLYR
ncbi:hypothetical protein YDYSG_61410 [Paenibacillus tyrfis]|uniref:tetratricopeptide repeat protein n=1 Tax=Paenibacillus tyrfis TaxID=1501230 RepID=UPI00249165A7|nr:tetratricopeptide repeat protein [Paenibacillus tyrfis]GLI10108.1 hypothetical protein YDYSG_61410 [Paenibacillus tyrfis]